MKPTSLFQSVLSPTRPDSGRSLGCRSLRRIWTLLTLAVALAWGADLVRAMDIPAQPGYLKGEFIYESAPFPSCHASTIAETKSGLVTAWFGGTAEKNPDVGIWVSRQEKGSWTAPVEVANGLQTDGPRLPCWNPVLFQPRTGDLLLFYKIGPSPTTWWGMLRTSKDQGRTWSAPQKLPDGMLGPIKNKPIQLPNGDILCPTSSEDQGWRVHFEIVDAALTQWRKVGPVNDPQEFGAIQPSILTHPDGKLEAVGRTRQQKVFQVWSEDGGKTWGKMSALELPNPNSGIDAVTLSNGLHLLIYNHTPRGRSPLNLASSVDGVSWSPTLLFEDQPGEYSYPAIIQTSDGLVHATYTWQRKRIKHVVLDPLKLPGTSKSPK